jgi:hypothetical protein
MRCKVARSAQAGLTQSASCARAACRAGGRARTRRCTIRWNDRSAILARRRTFTHRIHELTRTGTQSQGRTPLSVCCGRWLIASAGAADTSACRAHSVSCFALDSSSSSQDGTAALVAPLSSTALGARFPACSRSVLATCPRSELRHERVEVRDQRRAPAKVLASPCQQLSGWRSLLAASLAITAVSHEGINEYAMQGRTAMVTIRNGQAAQAQAQCRRKTKRSES